MGLAEESVCSREGVAGGPTKCVKTSIRSVVLVVEGKSMASAGP